MIGNCKVLAVTLARGGSERILRKNIHPICGVPLIEYTIREARKSKYIDLYCVSTEDREIRELCVDVGVAVVDRPVYLAGSNVTSSESLIHAVESVGGDYVYVVELMATNPLKTASDIDGVLDVLHNGEFDSVVSVVRVVDYHPSRLKYIEDGVMKDFWPEKLESRRQDLLPHAYVRNGSIYAMKKSFLLSERVRYNKETRPFEMDCERSVNIDEPMDLIVAEVMVSGRGL